MSINMQSKTLCRIYKIAGCILIWIAYTCMIVQLLKLNIRTPDAKKLELAQETYETDQRASVCFKDVIPFSIPLIQGSEICQNKPDLLIVVHTEAENVDIRNAYREKFTNRIKNTSTKYDFKADIVFLIGLNKRYCILTKTVEEIITYKDILVGSFIDNYYNQTLKSITMLEWFYKYCKSATLMLKLDERMDPANSLDSDTFYSLIRNVIRNEEKLILGSIKDVEITSQQHIPWISLPYLYPGLPRNLHLNYLLSRDSAESLLKAYTDTIYISVWKEDLYITGILANVAKLKITHNGNFLRKCGTTICIFCACESSSNGYDEETANSKLSSTSVASDLVTSDKLIHSIPKRDTQAAFQMYSSQSITTGTYPSTDHGEEWTTAAATTSPTTEFSTEYATSAETMTQHTTTESVTSTYEDDKTISTQTTMNTESTVHTTNLADDATYVTELSTVTTTTGIPNGEYSTITEIIEGIFLTDIPILQIDEFELGFAAAFLDDREQYLNNKRYDALVETTTTGAADLTTFIIDNSVLPSVNVDTEIPAPEDNTYSESYDAIVVSSATNIADTTKFDSENETYPTSDDTFETTSWATGTTKFISDDGDYSTFNNTAFETSTSTEAIDSTTFIDKHQSWDNPLSDNHASIFEDRSGVVENGVVTIENLDATKDSLTTEHFLITSSTNEIFNSKNSTFEYDYQDNPTPSAIS